MERERERDGEGEQWRERGRGPVRWCQNDLSRLDLHLEVKCLQCLHWRHTPALATSCVHLIISSMKPDFNVTCSHVAPPSRLMVKADVKGQ